MLLDGAPELPRAVGRVEALLDQQLDAASASGSSWIALAPSSCSLTRVDHQTDDAPDVLLAERVEHDDVVDPVEELGTEGPLQLLEHPLLHPLVGRLVADSGRNPGVMRLPIRLVPEVRGHDQDRVLEVDDVARASRSGGRRPAPGAAC